MPKNDHVKNALDRLGGSTAGQMAEEIGFNPDVPMPKPKVTGPDHAEGPGVPLDRGFTKKEMAEMNRADKEISRQITEEQKRNTKPKSIENSLLKLMKETIEEGGSKEQINRLRGTKPLELPYNIEYRPATEDDNADDIETLHTESGPMNVVQHRGPSYKPPDLQNTVENSLLKLMKASPPQGREPRPRHGLRGIDFTKLPIGASPPGKMTSDYGDSTRGGAPASVFQGGDAEMSASEIAETARGGPPTSPFPKEMTRVGTDEELATMYAEEDAKTRGLGPKGPRKSLEELTDSQVRQREANKLRARATAERNRKEREAQGLPPKRRGRPQKIEDSLLKLLKGNDIEHAQAGHNVPPHLHPKGLKEHLTNMSHDDIANLPMERIQGLTQAIGHEARIGDTKGNKSGWENHIKALQQVRAAHLPDTSEKLNKLQKTLLKLMKAPPQPGTPPGAPVKPNKPTVATSGAAGGGTPGGAAAAPGGAATTAPQTNPQVQQPQPNPSPGSAFTPTEHAKRPIQASIDKTDFPSGPQLSDDDWEIIRAAARKNKTLGEEHQPKSKGGVYSEDHIQNIQNSLLKIMKQPDRNDEIPRRSPLGPTHLTGPMMHPDDPTQVHDLPGAQASLAGGTMESQPGGGKITPVSRTQAMELPTQQEHEAWADEASKTFNNPWQSQEHNEAIRAKGGSAWKPQIYQNSVEKSLLKIMKKGMPKDVMSYEEYNPKGMYPDKNVPKASIPSTSIARPGDKFDIQQHARQVQADADLAQLAAGVKERYGQEAADKIVSPERAAQMGADTQARQRMMDYVRVGEGGLGNTRPRATALRNSVNKTLLKLMKAPTDLSAKRRNIHEQGKAKTAGAIKGQEETSQRGIGEMRTAGQTAEQDSARTTALGADIVGQSIGTASWMAGLGQRKDTPPGAPSGFMPDANTPGDVGANDNQAPPPQGSVGSGETATPTPETNAVPRKTPNWVRDAQNRIQ